MEIKDIKQLEEIIEYNFSSYVHIERALVHASYTDPKTGEQIPNNERLEFLGDRVLGIIVAEMLFTMFPQSTEGDLAHRFNALVRKETCADVARNIEIGKFIKMSPSEMNTGGRHRLAMLGDACEALIAAIYIDGGLENARKFIIKHWEIRASEVKRPPKDAKSMLQEWSQGLKLPMPKYKMCSKTGPDHEPEFTIEVQIKGWESEVAIGSSKRVAEHNAARSFLKREGILDEK